MACSSCGHKYPGSKLTSSRQLPKPVGRYQVRPVGRLFRPSKASIIDVVNSSPKDTVVGSSTSTTPSTDIKET